ncbi:MAG: hypothetical protein ACFCU3_01080 [Verrucomicrobiales bacterium]
MNLGLLRIFCNKKKAFSLWFIWRRIWSTQRREGDFSNCERHSLLATGLAPVVITIDLQTLPLKDSTSRACPGGEMIQIKANFVD